VKGYVALPPTIVGIRKLECFVLSHSENHMILSLFVWIGYQRGMDRQTDGQTDRRNCSSYYSALHRKQSGHTVKIKLPLKKNKLGLWTSYTIWPGMEFYSFWNPHGSKIKSIFICYETERIITLTRTRVFTKLLQDQLRL